MLERALVLFGTDIHINPSSHSSPYQLFIIVLLGCLYGINKFSMGDEGSALQPFSLFIKL